MGTKEPDDGRPAGDAEGSPLSDEVWEKFLRDHESDIRADAPKEPSARARMVTARLREQGAQAAAQQGERRRRLRKKAGAGAAGRPWQPEGWRTGPAWRGLDGRATRRRRMLSAVGVIAAVAVAVVAVNPSWALSHLPGGLGDRFASSGDAHAAPTPLPPETDRPTAAPSAGEPGVPTLKRTFAGSPAERWADGADAIVPPKATPVGTLSRAQVAFALKETRQLLVAANLDPRTLRGGRPREALDVIDPHQADLLDLLDTALRKPDKRHDPLTMFSRFNPHELRLVGDVVKVRGRMTFKRGERDSVVVHADYTFVYPVTHAGGGSTEVQRAIVRRVLDTELLDPTKYRVTPGKLGLIRYDEHISNSACEVYDGFLHPQFTTDAPSGAPATGPTTDPYDRSKPLDPKRADVCGTVTRT
ncbi:hypothetical protein ACIBJF_34175 [Streptomyces sp. NPDC050743]|uniref:hypothetical protein n=1 Tax=Streptomyces sp. NPDC050743 TaxID=3365634 RepID=UPI0037881370